MGGETQWEADEPEKMGDENRKVEGEKGGEREKGGGGGGIKRGGGRSISM